MARRVLNRRQLRVEAEQAAAADSQPDVAEIAKAKAPKAATRVKKPRAKKEPPRMRARWGVFDNAMKRVAIFDYNQRPAADQKLADLNAKKAGQYFLQIVKEPIAEPDVPEA
jgi:hypothetical protein